MKRFALLVLASPDSPGRLANGLNYACQLDEGGHEAAVFFDGAATRWFDQLEDAPPPVRDAYDEAEERGLIEGVCDHCANFLDAKEGAEEAGHEVEGTDHSPNVAELVDGGYELLTI